MSQKKGENIPLVFDSEDKESGVTYVDKDKYISKVSKLHMVEGFVILDNTNCLQQQWGKEFKET